MSTDITQNTYGDEPDVDYNGTGSRAVRRAAKKTARRDSQARGSGRSRRGRERRISVRGELRLAPDVRKIARAVIQIALAQAEAEAQAAAEAAQSEGARQASSDEASS